MFSAGNSGALSLPAIICLGYLAVINLITFIVYFSDKQRAIRHQWRVRERTLLLLAFIGGSAGALAAMLIFRHKTKHLQFVIPVPLFLILHLALLWFFFPGLL